MTNDANDIRINFGHVAFPYSVEEALLESASYRPDVRIIQTRRNISALKEYFKKHVPPTAAKKDENDESGAIAELLKMLLESKIDGDQENKAALSKEK